MLCQVLFDVPNIDVRVIHKNAVASQCKSLKNSNVKHKRTHRHAAIYTQRLVQNMLARVLLLLLLLVYYMRERA
jgi:hypothetical protein